MSYDAPDSVMPTARSARAPLLGRLRKRFAAAPLATKLLIVSITIVMPALMAAFAVQNALHYGGVRAALDRELGTQARIVAENVAAPILFDKRDEAEDVLRTLSASPHVEMAAVYRQSGERFASFVRHPDQARTQPTALRDTLSLPVAWGELRVTQPITQRGEALGVLVTWATLDEVHRGFVHQAKWAAVIVALSLGAILLVARRYMPRVVAPLQRLARLMEQVSDNGDYAARAKVESGDEIGSVARVFNRMLAEIQQHESSLRSELSERERAEQRLAHLAMHDPVTGLRNRHYFHERLSELLASARRGMREIGVMFLDLDNFKIVNDTLGHEAGDALLRTFAQRLTMALRASDTVCRLGGDEFAVILDGSVSRSVAEHVADKLLDVAREPVMLAGQEVLVTASVGIALYPHAGDDQETLVKNADTAMYCAKNRGKNSYEFFTSALLEATQNRFAMESRLRRALDRQEFSLVYQPIVDLATQHTTHAEALLRWNPSGAAAIAPSEFIPLAEDTGLIVPIGAWVLEQAVAACVRWRAQGLDAGVSVNVSAKQLGDHEFVGLVRDVLRRHGLPAHELIIEITESVLVSSLDGSREVLDALKAVGVKLVIDDFGTGYSSLAYLARLSVDGLKIDRALIENLPHNSESLAITNAVIAMAHAIHADVVAEGVELDEQAQVLARHGCGVAQGFLYGAPVAPDRLIALAHRISGYPTRIAA